MHLTKQAEHQQLARGILVSSWCVGVSPIISSGVVLAFVLTGSLCGVLLGMALPKHHLSAESKDVIKLATGLVGTMVALVLGLLVASAKSFYDTQGAELTQLSAQAVILDRTLAHYGPEAKHARELLRTSVGRLLDRLRSDDDAGSAALDPASANAEVLLEAVQHLSPANDAQRWLQTSAVNTMSELSRTRWLMYEQVGTGLPRPLLIVLILWLSLLFLSFGLFAPTNATAAFSLFLAALSVSGAVLMVLEMYSPCQGLVQVSREPLRAALAHLGQ